MTEQGSGADKTRKLAVVISTGAAEGLLHPHLIRRFSTEERLVQKDRTFVLTEKRYVQVDWPVPPRISN